MSSNDMSNYDQQQEQHPQRQQQDKEPSTIIRKLDSSISIIRQSRALALNNNRQKRPYLTPLLIPDEDCKGSNSSRWANPRKFHFRGLGGSPSTADQLAATPGSPRPHAQSPSSLSDRTYRFKKMASLEERLFCLQQECDNFHNYVTNRIDDLASEMEFTESPIFSKHKSSSVVLKEKLSQIVHQMKGLTYSPHRQSDKATVVSEEVFPQISCHYQQQSSCHFNSPIDQGDDKENMDRQIQIGVAKMTLTTHTEQQLLQPQHVPTSPSPIHLTNTGTGSRFVDLFSPSPRFAAMRIKAKRGRKLHGAAAAAGPGFNLVTGQGEWRYVQTPCNSPLIETANAPITSTPTTTTTEEQKGTPRYIPSWFGGATSPAKSVLDYE